MNIMITGGAGFIGSSLARELKNEHDIIIVDNFSTGSEDNIKNLIQKGIKVHDLDLASTNSIKYMDRYLKNIDVVYHFAASIGVDLVLNNSSETLLNSFNINNNMFPLFEKHSVKVIFSSTSEVYGETSIDGAKETDNLSIMSTPRGSYASAKLTSEFLLRSYNFPYVITRFFNIVGPSQVGHYGHVLPKFISAAINNESLKIYNGGKSIRSFCDIRDAVQMLKILLDDKHNGEIYNIGSDFNTVSIKNLAFMVISILNSESEFENIEKDNEDIHYRVPNTDKINKYYNAQYALEDIIRNIYEKNFINSSAS